MDKCDVRGYHTPGGGTQSCNTQTCKGDTESPNCAPWELLMSPSTSASSAPNHSQKFPFSHCCFLQHPRRQSQAKTSWGSSRVAQERCCFNPGISNGFSSSLANIHQISAPFPGASWQLNLLGGLNPAAPQQRGDPKTRISLIFYLSPLGASLPELRQAELEGCKTKSPQSCRPPVMSEGAVRSLVSQQSPTRRKPRGGGTRERRKGAETPVLMKSR